MARAKRHYIPGYIWHITHRCHKREFLLRHRGRWCRKCLTTDGLMYEVFVMLRLARLDAPGVVHHVTGRGMERRKIFFDAIDRPHLSFAFDLPFPEIHPLIKRKKGTPSE